MRGRRQGTGGGLLGLIWLLVLALRVSAALRRVRGEHPLQDSGPLRSEGAAVRRGAGAPPGRGDAPHLPRGTPPEVPTRASGHE